MDFIGFSEEIMYQLCTYDFAAENTLRHVLKQVAVALRYKKGYDAGNSTISVMLNRDRRSD